MRSRREVGPPLTCPTTAELKALRQVGVELLAVATPLVMKVATGYAAADGLFEPEQAGDRWFAFEEPQADDVIFWHWPSRRLCSWANRVFALGEILIDEAATYSFDCNLNIFANPLDWLCANREGIVVLPHRWPDAFDRLRDAPRIAIAETLLPIYRRHMKPRRMPELLVVPQQRAAA